MTQATTVSIDLNADLGEADTDIGHSSELAILSAITSANIACGGHAGDEHTMRATIRGAKLHNVVIGAHPAFPDRENFGRKSLKLGQDIDVDVLRNSIAQQITTLCEIAAQEGVIVHYVKPHGTLYTDSMRDPVLARLVTDVVKTLDPTLPFMGAPDSELEKAAYNNAQTFIAEGFVDRRYMPDGTLVPRTQDGAVISAEDDRLSQARQIALDKTVTALNGETISIPAETLCLHGDSPGAVTTAKNIRSMLEDAGVTVRSFIADSSR